MRRCLNCMSEYPDHDKSCPYCGFIHGVTEDGGINLQPGSILQGRYIVGTMIKARETDIFYIGWDALFERKVQIQEYFPRYCATRSGGYQLNVYDSKRDTFENGLGYFMEHSRQLIRLYKEEDVITYHACFTENGTAYAIMEHRQDETLRERLMRGKIQVKEAQSWLFKAAEAVEKAHEIGVCHGYIGLESFWVQPGDSLILKDFGAARYISGQPGIVDYGRISSSTDVYGLARMFCQMLIGEEDEEEERLEAELTRHTSLKKTAVTALKAALCHQTDTVERFCLDFLGERHAAAGKQGKRNSRNSLALPRWVKALAAAVLAAILGFTVLVSTGVVELKFQHEKSSVEDGMARVPNVVNKDADKAERELKRIGLRMDRSKTEYSKDVPPNRISSQNQKEGSQVQKGTVVEVCISMGPEKAVIPDVVGLAKDEAMEDLQKSGFTHITVEDSQDLGIYGTVIGISQEQGSNVDLDQELILTICKNEYSGESDTPVTVPDILDMNEEDARKRLEDSKFQVTVAYSSSDKRKGKVFKQNPEGGKSANQGSCVMLSVSKGPEPVYMKNVTLMTEEEARETIKAMNLDLSVITEEKYHDSVAKGKVISQSIKQDALVEPGAEVRLTVSLGMKARAEETKARPQTEGAGQETKAVPQTQAESAPETTQETASETTQKPAPETVPETAKPEQGTSEDVQGTDAAPKGDVIESGASPLGTDEEPRDKALQIGPGTTSLSVPDETAPIPIVEPRGMPR